MTKNDRKFLLNFIVRTGMYVFLEDKNNIVSYISGYEAGTKNRCSFTKFLEQFMRDNYKIPVLSTRWPGQIESLAKKLSASWIVIFKKLSLEIIISEDMDGLDEEMEETLRSSIRNLISRIKPSGDIYFNENWIKEWISIASSKKQWFKGLWTTQEWKILKAVGKAIEQGAVFQDKKIYIPSSRLIQLKEQYNKLP